EEAGASGSAGGRLHAGAKDITAKSNAKSGPERLRAKRRARARIPESLTTGWLAHFERAGEDEAGGRTARRAALAYVRSRTRGRRGRERPRWNSSVTTSSAA